MGKRADLFGQRFGRLSVLSFEGIINHAACWRCLCDCGNEKTATTESLRGGGTKSCGCLRRENTSKMFTKHGATKDDKWSPEYRAWVSMNTRCKYENREDFKWYGSQGISVCAEWRESFEAFYAHIGPRPSPKHSVDRINPWGNYEPGNVRWATPKEQEQNKRSKRPKPAA